MYEAWTEKVKNICKEYNIPFEYLPDIINDPKVIPMIRGKGFEFSVMLALQNLLPNDQWEVNKPFTNPQLGSHDVDVRVTHKATGKIIRVECKLAKKESYRFFKTRNEIEIKVKCMRSRTLGQEKVKELARKWQIQEELLSIHNDQYLPKDFDVVITSIGNAFYRTNERTKRYEWQPTKEEQDFLKKLYPSQGASLSDEDLKNFAFKKMYVARTQDLAIRQNSGQGRCTRRKCKEKDNCGFIPNYPIIRFDAETQKPKNKWVSFEDSIELFKSFVE